MIIGIDLGTTNCACAVFRNGDIEMIPNSLGHVLTPSAVSLDDGGQIITGLAARERQSTHANTTVTAFKRYMGTKHVATLGRQRFTPEELSSLMLRSLKADAEAYLGETVTEAVITVPAYFNDKQRKATRQAGLLAGLTVERLINEPTAAALAYGIHQRDKETRFLVFDLGGGTFDVSVLEIFEGVIEVRASAGDNRLGGEDFNEVLVDIARRKFPNELGKGTSDRGGPVYQKLREAAERTRRALTESHVATMSIVHNGKPLETEITTEQFETECEPLITRLRDPVLRALKDSNIQLASLNELILVGGATRMPVIRKAVTRMFGRFPATAVNPDEAVARGAAVQAALKSRDADLKEVVLTDVCPYSLGVEVAEGGSGGQLINGLFRPIIERNCVVPASREEVFSSVQDFQTAIQFNIYQGEARWVRDNVLLGSLDVEIPRKKRGEVPVHCRFSYDINGLLEIDAHVPASGLQRQLVILDKEGLTDAQIEARRAELAKIKVHPRDSDAMRAALARAGRCYENAIGDERDAIGHMITEFEQVLAGQDPRECEAARVNLMKILDRIEGESFL